MKPEVFFSIIIPTYNRADFIKATVQSALMQTYSAFEVIVVDDGSTDNTDEIIASITHPKLTYYKKNNAERAAARNYGAQKAKGNYLNFFDSDDLLLPHHLQTAADFIEANNKPEVFHLSYNFIDDKGKLLQNAKPVKGDLNKQLIVDGNCMSCNGVFLRKDIAGQFPFNENRDLSGTEDHELWLRLAARFEIKYCNTITSSIIQHDLRSVMEVNGTKLIKRLELFIKYVEADSVFQEKYKALTPPMKAQAWSYIAIHFAITHNNFKEAMHYFLKAFKIYPPFVFQKRYWAIIKHLVKSI